MIEDLVLQKEQKHKNQMGSALRGLTYLFKDQREVQ